MAGLLLTTRALRLDSVITASADACLKYETVDAKLLRVWSPKAPARTLSMVSRRLAAASSKLPSDVKTRLATHSKVQGELAMTTSPGCRYTTGPFVGK